MLLRACDGRSRAEQKGFANRDFCFVFLTTCGRQGLALSTLGLHGATQLLCVTRIWLAEEDRPHPL